MFSFVIFSRHVSFYSNCLFLEIGSVIMFTEVEFSANSFTFNDTGEFEFQRSCVYFLWLSALIEIENNRSEFHTYVNGKIFTKIVKHNYEQEPVVFSSYSSRTKWYCMGSDCLNLHRCTWWHLRTSQLSKTKQIGELNWKK